MKDKLDAVKIYVDFSYSWDKIVCVCGGGGGRGWYMCNKLGRNIVFDIGETWYIICTVFDGTYNKFVTTHDTLELYTSDGGCAADLALYFLNMNDM